MARGDALLVSGESGDEHQLREEVADRRQHRALIVRRARAPGP